ncbi:ABC transporter permease [Roseixanthobacter pseudopolyaromaticivorans]|uniref:ABC transporter permease n=1 Tax=Xanthobacteraceae TaxID=335928 RepID=UPI00372B5E01
MKHELTGGLAVVSYAVTALMLVFVLAPLAIVFVISVSDTPLAVFPPRGFTLGWYWKVLGDPGFRGAVGFSLGLALSATLASLALGIPAALVLVRHPFAGQSMAEGVLMSPLVFPTLIMGVALLQFYAMWNMQNSAINLFFAHILVTLPYVMRTVMASLRQADMTLEEAALTLGANRFRVLWRVTLPQIAPGVAAGALFAFMLSFDNYPISMWLSDAKAEPLPIYLIQAMQRIFDPSVAAMASLMTLIGAVAVFVVEKLVGLRRAMSV